MISNYPDGISPGDPAMPWNEPDEPEWLGFYDGIDPSLPEPPDTPEDAARYVGNLIDALEWDKRKLENYAAGGPPEGEDMEESKEQTYEMLRRVAGDSSAVEPFDRLTIKLGCDIAYSYSGQSVVLRALADRIEAEQRAIAEAQGKGVHHIMKAYAEKAGMPMEEGETITEWLDRWFVPRPRYEDGAPVQFGDEHYWADCTMRKITGFGQTENGAPYITCAFDGNGMSDAMIYSGFLRRPTPKALDAGGVEIAEGDTVWDIKSGNKFNVQCLDPFKVVGFGGISSTWFRPEEFTHRKPDSLEKLRDDLDAFMRDCSINADKVDEFCDRLTALMERGV